jgi:hypothetical protein
VVIKVLKGLRLDEGIMESSNCKAPTYDSSNYVHVKRAIIQKRSRHTPRVHSYVVFATVGSVMTVKPLDVRVLVSLCRALERSSKSLAIIWIH